MRIQSGKISLNDLLLPDVSIHIYVTNQLHSILSNLHHSIKEWDIGYIPGILEYFHINGFQHIKMGFSEQVYALSTEIINIHLLLIFEIVKYEILNQIHRALRYLILLNVYIGRFLTAFWIVLSESMLMQELTIIMWHYLNLIPILLPEFIIHILHLLLN